MSAGATRQGATLGPSGHADTFARDNLPPRDLWPDFLLDRPEFQYPDWLNAGVELSDRLVEQGFGDHIALIGNGRVRTYKELSDWTNRLAHALVEDFGVKPGNRVLVRSGNNPAMVAAWLSSAIAAAGSALDWAWSSSTVRVSGGMQSIGVEVPIELQVQREGEALRVVTVTPVEG